MFPPDTRSGMLRRLRLTAVGRHETRPARRDQVAKPDFTKPALDTIVADLRSLRQVRGDRRGWMPLHDGANEGRLQTLAAIGTADRIPEMLRQAKDKNDPFR